MIRLMKFTAVLAMTFMVVAGAAYGQMAGQTFAEGVVSDDGAIRLPAGFRTAYVMLGAWSVAGDVDSGGEIGMHVVYAPKSAVEGYRKSGAFPDGTVLVKELFNTETEDLTTGRATHAAGIAGYFVMVKDDKNRFPDNPLWGDGWGWSFFAVDNTTTTTTADYRSECLACHEPARSTDLVYIEAYPVLK